MEHGHEVSLTAASTSRSRALVEASRGRRPPRLDAAARARRPAGCVAAPEPRHGPRTASRAADSIGSGRVLTASPYPEAAALRHVRSCQTPPHVFIQHRADTCNTHTETMTDRRCHTVKGHPLVPPHEVQHPACARFEYVAGRASRIPDRARAPCMLTATTARAQHRAPSRARRQQPLSPLHAAHPCAATLLCCPSRQQTPLRVLARARSRHAARATRHSPPASARDPVVLASHPRNSKGAGGSGSSSSAAAPPAGCSVVAVRRSSASEGVVSLSSTMPALRPAEMGT
jgi:hypothetical protein